MSLKIEYIITSENKLEIKPIGEVDIYTSPELKNKILELIDDKKLDIIINGEKLEYIDSTGLGVLMSIYKKMQENSLNIKILNLKSNIYKLFDITGLIKVFDIQGWKMDKINLTIPKKSEYMSTIRLTTSALSNLNGFNIDDIEDLKVIISEVCSFFINNVEQNGEPLKIEYHMESGSLKVEVSDLNRGKVAEKNKANSEMCVMIIESLADNYSFDLENKKIIFEKNINIE